MAKKSNFLIEKKDINSGYLYIDAVSSHDLHLMLFNKHRILKQVRTKQGANTEKFLSILNNFLVADKSISIGGMVIAQGQGSYCQNRIVTAIANTLAYVWQISVARIDIKKNNQVFTHLSRVRFSQSTNSIYYN
ncbi:MAG: hypothetical protein WC575_00175 [Patescibacteria group bacterium]